MATWAASLAAAAKDRGERIGEVRRLEGEEKIRVNEVRDAELRQLLEGEVVALALRAGTVEEADGTIVIRRATEDEPEEELVD